MTAYAQFNLLLLLLSKQLYYPFLPSPSPFYVWDFVRVGKNPEILFVGQECVWSLLFPCLGCVWSTPTYYRIVFDQSEAFFQIMFEQFAAFSGLCLINQKDTPLKHCLWPLSSLITAWFCMQEQCNILLLWVLTCWMPKADLRLVSVEPFIGKD